MLHRGSYVANIGPSHQVSEARGYRVEQAVQVNDEIARLGVVDRGWAPTPGRARGVVG